MTDSSSFVSDICMKWVTTQHVISQLKTLTFDDQLKFAYYCVDSGVRSHASKVSTKTIIFYITQLCVSGITSFPHSRS